MAGRDGDDAARPEEAPDPPASTPAVHEGARPAVPVPAGLEDGADPLAAPGPARRLEAAGREEDPGGSGAKFAPLLADAGESTAASGPQRAPDPTAPGPVPLVATDYGPAATGALEDDVAPADAADAERRLVRQTGRDAGAGSGAGSGPGSGPGSGAGTGRG
ncbi:hypothetical protein [Kineococcus sp. SYSU DK005]|uniref:hypothetical protein n=1 Tax=Kineococcus sp. SYSU DK005 TaxID=3383126 RepID=UPI003D7D08B1